MRQTFFLRAFAAATLLVAHFQFLEKASRHDIAAGGVVIAVGILAPLGHLVGLVLGVMALFSLRRSGFAGCSRRGGNERLSA